MSALGSRSRTVRTFHDASGRPTNTRGLFALSRSLSRFVDCRAFFGGCGFGGGGARACAPVWRCSMCCRVMNALPTRSPSIPYTCAQNCDGCGSAPGSGVGVVVALALRRASTGFEGDLASPSSRTSVTLLLNNEAASPPSLIEMNSSPLFLEQVEQLHVFVHTGHKKPALCSSKVMSGYLVRIQNRCRTRWEKRGVQ